MGADMDARRGAAALTLVVAMAVTGCAGGSEKQVDGADPGVARSEGSRAAVEAQRAAPEAEGAADTEDTASEAADEAAPAQGEHIVRTAELEIRVPSVPRALKAARAAAEEAGGDVSEESTTGEEEPGGMYSSLVLRVPEDRYDAVLTRLAGAGKLLNRSARAEDVTEEVVDVRSRLATQRASVERVRKLMDRAGKLTDVVALEEQLGKRQADLEALLAKEKSLKDRTTLATITLSLQEEAEKDGTGDGDGPGFLDALGGGWDALVTSSRWTGAGIGAALPFAAVLGAAFAVWRWALRPVLRSRARRAADAVSAGERRGSAPE
ncbi:lipoprotein [Streptomyces clavuligerus]|nr:lipoprotein [Streptomyces clavuligerus]